MQPSLIFFPKQIHTLKEGLLRGLGAQHCLMRSLNPSGQVEGMGSCSELLPTPQMMAELSTFL